ncbi:MAG: hypothetical protein AAF799_05115 [Myxococcota bacterium]
MAEVDPTEAAFIRTFAQPEEAERHLSLLRGRKHRSEFLEQLNHSFQTHGDRGRELGSEWKNPSSLLALAAELDFGETMHVIADGTPMDGQSLRIERAVETLVGNNWGTVLVAPSVRYALYKTQDPGPLFLLSERPVSDERLAAATARR